ncbi:hypothetical protein AXG93_2272s1010 [Marchantia polymorpha subsp. ruderalis]|uniref:Uncharacterized protein n=1 Tax=Marchantia polymorpha subsp. ruderalis TaxID=1480154 RepID=A0A176VRI3_MARPO|nr:hypothetical protein AXG93_2272s1010 [Marchantia polymorpha subsp. ruderalis]
MMTGQQPAPLTQVSSGTIDLESGEGPSAKESKSVGLSAVDMLGKQVIPLLKYLDEKMAKYAKPTIAGSYVELVRSKTRAKVATSAEVVERVLSLTSECTTAKATLQEWEKRLQQTESKCAGLWKTLAAEKNLQVSSERDCMNLRVDIQYAQKATVNLEQIGAELAAKAKELANCKATRSSKLEQREKLDANCNELRSQLLAVEEQLIAAEAKLLELEAKNQQLADQTDEALRAKVNRCFHDYVEWEIQTLKWMKLRELERRVTALIACSARGHWQLGKKLDLFISGLEETKVNLELKVLAALRRIGVSRNSAGVITIGSAGITLVGSSHPNK